MSIKKEYIIFFFQNILKSQFPKKVKFVAFSYIDPVTCGHIIRNVYISNTDAETSVTIHTEDVVICPQETVTFTCTVQSGRALQWEAKPFITSTLNQIRFLPNDIMPTRDFISSGVRFEAVLTQSELVQGSSTHYTLQSTLSTTASTTTNGTVIECQEYYTAAYDNSTLQLNGQCYHLRL